MKARILCSILLTAFSPAAAAHQSQQKFFGLYSVFEKFASISGPLLFSYSIRMTGKSELAIMSIAIFFVVGMVVLSRVNVDEGRRIAREAEQDVRLSVIPVAPPAVA